MNERTRLSRTRFSTEPRDRRPIDRRTKLVLALSVAAAWWLVSVACGSGTLGPQDRVNVNCNGIGHAYECVVQHTQGNNRVTACWTLNITCADGSQTSAHACQTVGSGETATRLIPVSDIPNFSSCVVQNLSLTMDPLTQAN